MELGTPSPSLPFRSSPTSLEGRRETWQQELREAPASIEELEQLGVLTSSEVQTLRELGLADRSRLRVPLSTLRLMDQGNPECPIRLQSLPSTRELDPVLPEAIRTLSERAYGRPLPWTPDPIGDLDRLASPRLTHRYGNRALLHFSSSCALYCRFCFRKEHLSASEEALYSGSFDEAFRYLSSAPEVRELILTGGDPLTHVDSRLGLFLDRVARELPAIRTVRLHSRMASSLPSRLTPALAATLGEERGFAVHFVSHFNHPLELTAEARAGLRRLARAGVTLWNQNVLLRGVNADETVLESLYQSLYETGVAPYYLHHPDWTPGTFGFRVSIEEGRRIVRALKGRLPGPAVPDYVLDLPGGFGKVPLLDTERVKRLEADDFTWSLSAGEAKAYGLPPQAKGRARLYSILPPMTRHSSARSEERVLALDLSVL